MLSLAYLLSLVDESRNDKVMRLYKFHTDMIIVAKSRLRSAHVPSYQYDAEDVVQSAFENMIKYIDSIDFDVPDVQLRGYVLTVVANQVNRLLRNRVITEDIDDYTDITDDIDIIDEIQHRDDRIILSRAIKSMDEIYSYVIVAHYINEMSVKEISEELNLPEKTIYTRLRRARQALYKILKDTYPDKI